MSFSQSGMNSQEAHFVCFHNFVANNVTTQDPPSLWRLSLCCTVICKKNPSGWFLQNREKVLIQTNMHTIVDELN